MAGEVVAQCRAGDHIHCSSPVPAFEGINLLEGLFDSHQQFSPFLFPSTPSSPPTPRRRSQLCCRASSPPSKFNLLIGFVTGAFPGLLHPASLLWKKKITKHMGAGWQQWLCALAARLFKENSEVEIFQICQRDKNVQILLKSTGTRHLAS